MIELVRTAQARKTPLYLSMWDLYCRSGMTNLRLMANFRTEPTTTTTANGGS